MTHDDARPGLTWGVKRSFVAYLASLEDGAVSVDDGATVDEATHVHFPLESAADFDPGTDTGTVRFAGRVALSGHVGMMSLEIERPWLVFSETGCQLTVPDPDRGGEHRIPIADLRWGSPSDDPPTGRRQAAATLTVEGTSLFSHHYAPEEQLDPVTFTLADAANPPQRIRTDAPTRLSLVVLERIVEAQDVVSLVLADPDGNPLPRWSPGAHVDVQLADDTVRQYSLSCAPAADPDRWRITVLREQGRASTAIHSIRPGSVLDVSLPRNNFELRPAPAYVFVAGGIGITPIMTMIAEADRTGTAWSLVYTGRSRDRMAFLDDLSGRDGVRIVASALEGRFDFAEHLATPAPGTLVYACGPEGLLAHLEAISAAWPSGTLHTERFVPREFDDSGDVDFTVEFADSGITATIPVGRSILEIAEENDIPVISSCAEGTCGTCETAVLDGVPDHRDSILTDDERAANDTIFICVSRSVGGCPLRLDL